MRRHLLVSLIALSACKGKPEHRPPPANLGSAVVATGSDGKRAAPDLALPPSPATAPPRTTRRLGRADFEQLAKLEFPGFTREPHGLNDVVVEVRQVTKDHPRLWTTITIEPCGAGSAAGSGSATGSGSAASSCWPMDIEFWKKHEDELKKQWLGDALYGAPDVDWQMGNMIMFGIPMIWTYQLGQHAGSGAGGGTLSFTDAFILFYNDGFNQIRVVSEYKDDPLKTKEMMAQVAPKTDLQTLAMTFMNVYTHAWPTK